MQASLAPHFGELDTAHAVHHASEDRSGSLDQRLVRIEHALGPQLHARLLDCNRLDLALYAEALQRFEQARTD